MNFHILTLFPDMVRQGLSTSILGRATNNGQISINTVNIRDYTTDKHKKVDDYPYGGGAGMLMQAQPVFDAYKDVVSGTTTVGTKKPRCVYVTPQGTVFTQSMAEELAKEPDLIFLCGHYEGVDERVLDEIVTDYVSIGDYVLTGGELPAMVMVDAIARLIPGVLNNSSSAETESFFNYLLEHPQYTRPEEWRGKKVPEVLLSGDHKKISEWHQEQAVQRTKSRRPDLYERYEGLLRCNKELLKNKLLHIDMTQLIFRGQAEILYHGKPQNILIWDKVSGIYFVTSAEEEQGVLMLEIIKKHANSKGRMNYLLVSHQEFMGPLIEMKFQMQPFLTSYQVVYTRKGPLPANKKVDVRKLEFIHVQEVIEQYSIVGEEEIRERISSGNMWGAFLQGKLIGFIGIHREGSIGMLHVLPEYRNGGIAMALETEVINRMLEKGLTPYGQVEENNHVSRKLQEKLGFYFSKDKVHWYEIEENNK